MSRAFTDDQKHELRVRFLSSAIAGIAQSAAGPILKTLSEKQRKQPELAAAIMADRLARSAVYVLTTDKPEKTEEGGASWGS